MEFHYSRVGDGVLTITEISETDREQAFDAVRSRLTKYFIKHELQRSREPMGDKIPFKIDEIREDESGRPKITVVVGAFLEKGIGPQIEIHILLIKEKGEWQVDGHLAFVCDTKEMLWDELQGISTDETGAEASEEAAVASFA